jgi:hypothetical protein
MVECRIPACGEDDASRVRFSLLESPFTAAIKMPAAQAFSKVTLG